MSKSTFNIVGWILLLGLSISWIGFGYSSWYLLLPPLAYLCFSINDDMAKRIKMITLLSFSQIIFILFTLIVSVGIVFGLIQLANYLINDMFQLSGWIKSFSQIIAIILSLYPVKFTFGSVVYKVIRFERKRTIKL